MHYLLQDKPGVVDEVAKALHLNANDAFHVRLPLDWASATHHRDVDHEYTLVPVRGAGGRLFVILPGLANPAALGEAPELHGRVIGRGWMGDWDAGEIDTEIQLQDEFAGRGVHVASDALLLVPGWRFTPDVYWQLLLGFVSPIILMYLFLGWWARRRAVRRT